MYPGSVFSSLSKLDLLSYTHVSENQPGRLGGRSLFMRLLRIFHIPVSFSALAARWPRAVQPGGVPTSSGN